MLPPDKLVEPLYERETDNAPGPFYVVKDGYIICGLPPQVAPQNITWSKETFKGNREGCPTHCRVERQPETLEEIDQMVEAVWGSCVASIRYCGTNPLILKKLQARGCESQCDVVNRNEAR